MGRAGFEPTFLGHEPSVLPVASPPLKKTMFIMFVIGIEPILQMEIGFKPIASTNSAKRTANNGTRTRIYDFTNRHFTLKLYSL